VSKGVGFGTSEALRPENVSCLPSTDMILVVEPTIVGSVDARDAVMAMMAPMLVLVIMLARARNSFVLAIESMDVQLAMVAALLDVSAPSMVALWTSS
jgi:hypothetical protein